MEPLPLTKILPISCFLGLCILGLYFYCVAWVVPERVRRKLLVQGICGPEPAFPYGNISEMKRLTVMEKSKRGAEDGGGAIEHDYRSAVFPYYERWRKEYEKRTGKQRARISGVQFGTCN